MKLIGMIDSPYVRRVAISFTLLGIAFEHLPFSVFSELDKFKAINPVLKVPTLVTDDGTVLMESCLILDYAERLAAPQRSLLPTDISTYTRAQRLTGLALAACEKAVQAVYEHRLRPAEKRHQPWLDRVHAQLDAALALLEAEVKTEHPWLFGKNPLQADVTIAVAFRFACSKLSDHVKADDYPALAAFSAWAEEHDAFKAFPLP